MTGPFRTYSSHFLEFTVASAFGMRLADTTPGRCDGVFGVPNGGGLRGLTPKDRQVLEDWLASAEKYGIETACDFTARSWQAALPATAIGVFETGRAAASWLVVRSQDGWAVAAVRNDTVSDAMGTLADALRLIRA